MVESTGATGQVIPPFSKTNSRAPGLQASYYGPVLTHPNLFAVYNIWESIHSHHKFQHSPEYGPFLFLVFPMLDGPIKFAHLDVENMKELRTTLESPVHQTSSLNVAMDKAGAYLKWWDEDSQKYLGGEKMNAIWLGYSYEDPYVHL